MGGFIQVLTGSFLLSVVHALIPNHWIPLVAIGKTEQWSRRETLGVTAITGIAHSLSTILIGIVVGFIGYKLSGSYAVFSHIVAPLILVGLGVIYLVLDSKGNHGHHHAKNDKISRKSKFAIVTSLAVAMFFSPCIEIEIYYLSASALGWLGIGTVSVIYLVVTVLGMLLLVDLGRRGIERVHSHFLERHERGITGALLVFLGICAFIFEHLFH
jgi:putative Mn2+ efflux pump MntP